MSEWTARRILREVATPEQRKDILATFWREADEHARHSAVAVLAKALRFREQTLRAATVEKKADLLASRLGSPDLENTFETALMAHHTSRERAMMAAFLDRWGVPHEDGLIEAEEYAIPSKAQIEESVRALEGEYPLPRILVYLASIGLLMGADLPAWRDAAWPVVDRHAPR
ncbi:MAG: hypothetical protein ACRD2J_14265 [Thermoanaerobaculia bacterium]